MIDHCCLCAINTASISFCKKHESIRRIVIGGGAGDDSGYVKGVAGGSGEFIPDVKDHRLQNIEHLLSEILESLRDIVHLLPGDFT